MEPKANVFQLSVMKEGGQAPNPRLLHPAEPGRSSMHRGQETLHEQHQPDFPDPGDALLKRGPWLCPLNESPHSLRRNPLFKLWCSNPSQLSSCLCLPPPPFCPSKDFSRCDEFGHQVLLAGATPDLGQGDGDCHGHGDSSDSPP